MRRSFYHYMMTRRVAKIQSSIDELADAMFYDDAFPKQSTDFNQVSRYFEDHVDYLKSLSIFDQAWEEYLASEA
ncbi:MAG: YozE family protein [Streptococcaceae bacterium]|nr:YozE family protein [Streptococcaceae bacterium]MCH4178037.1 YozE family protein [Streptococcaceae bacterium]